MATSEGRVPQSMYDVLYLISESGYLLGNLNPTAEGYYFAWDTVGQKIVYIKEDLDTVIYPEDYTIDKSKCWITVGDQAEAERVAAAGYNLYLERSIDLIRLVDCAVSIDTGAYQLKTLEINGTSVDAKSIVLTGNFGTMSVGIANVNSTVTGSIQNLTVGGSGAAMSINGSVSNVSSSLSNAINMGSTGYVGSINGGSVQTGSGTLISSGSASGASNGVISISNKEAIENIRTQIAGGRTFAGETITLSNDINMAGIAFQPISNNSRSVKSMKNAEDGWFQGEFDGKGHTIQNFTTNGFSIAGLNAGTNGTSEPFNGSVYNEAVYGLFGALYIPDGETVVIKNLTIQAAIDMTIDEAEEYVGDSVGALIGFALGAGTLKIENVHITGFVNGYDGVAGFIGRAYGISADNANPSSNKYLDLGFTDKTAHNLTIIFNNCTNDATITGVRKTGAFIGSASCINREFHDCVNNGNITCLGVLRDKELGASSAQEKTVAANGSSYYQAGVFMDNSTVARLSFEGITNNGTIKVGE